MRFADLAPQPQVQARLVQAAQANRLPHAMLFAGPQGSGRLPLAHALAQYLLCEAPTNNDACGACPGCHKAATWAHPDLQVVMPHTTTTGSQATQLDDLMEPFRQATAEDPYLTLPDWAEHLNAENKQLVIPIHAIRQLNHRLSMQAYEGGARVVILWRADRLNVEAANAFLKRLEEPTPGTYFILTAENPHQLLQTVLSRCQVVPIPPLAPEAIETYLSRITDLSSEALKQAAALGRGSISRAQAMTEAAELDALSRFRDWLRACMRWDENHLQAWATETARLPKEAQKLFLQGGLDQLEACLWARYNQPVPAPDQAAAAFYTKFGQYLGPQGYEPLAQALEDALRGVNGNANGTLLYYQLSNQVRQVLLQHQAA